MPATKFGEATVVDEIKWTSERAGTIVEAIETVIVGKRPAVELAIIGLLCNGHILIEDIPGVGKTMLAKALAAALGAKYRRIQFTPDLLPADITGTSIFNQKTGEFSFRPGPIFTNVLLADEINRATPKTQSSLLECMEEFQVTVDGATRQLQHPFFVIATENPIEYRGTYPLPEAQLDRFLMRVSIGYPQPSEEIVVLDRQVKKHPIHSVESVVDHDEMLRMQEHVKDVHIDSSLKQYLVDVVTATRDHPMLTLGASPRASLGLMRTSQARAALDGRDFVLPDDIKGLAASVLCHRLILKPEARVSQTGADEIVAEILGQLPVPAAR
jgi:MoxR-like ATPase